MNWLTRPMLILGTAFTLWYSLPSEEAGTDPCAMSDPPSKLRDLATVQAWGVPQHTSVPLLLREKQVGGREGERDSLRITVDERPWIVWLVTRDSVGNVACDSPHVGLNLTVDVPPDTLVAARWYDVAGRRVRPPLPPGVYVVRQGDHVRKVVLLP